MIYIIFTCIHRLLPTVRVHWYLTICYFAPVDLIMGVPKNNLCGSFYELPIFNGLPVIPGFTLKLKSY